MIKTNKKILSVFALLLVILLLIIVYTKRGHSYAVELYKTGQGWGYDIIINDRTYIHQPFMPAVEGQVPFKDKKSARKTAWLVVRKIRNHKSPAVTKYEIDSILKE